MRFTCVGRRGSRVMFLRDEKFLEFLIFFERLFLVVGWRAFNRENESG